MVEADLLGTLGGSEEHGGYGERRRRRRAPLGRVQGGKQRRERGPGEERGGAGGEGKCVASPEGSGRKQEVARGERARGRHASVLLAREEDDRGGSGGGLGRAGPGKWAPGNFLLSLSLLFLFYFCYFVFDLI